MKILKQTLPFVLMLLAVGVLFHTVGARKAPARQHKAATYQNLARFAKKSTMPNPQIAKGASANVTMTGSPVSSPYPWTIRKSDTTTLATQASPNGWAVTGNSSPVSVSVPTSATVATGDTVDFNDGRIGVFDVIAAAGPTTYPARTVTNSIFSESASTGTFHRGPMSFPAQYITNSIFGESGSRGPMTLAPRVVSQTLFAEKVPSAAQALPGATVTNSFLTESALRGPASYTPRILTESLLFSSAARSGRVSPAGGTAPPIASFEPALFTQTASRGPFSFGPRIAVNKLFAETATSGPRSLATRTATNTLFAEIAGSAGSVSPPLNPGNVDIRDPFAVLWREIQLILFLKGNSMSTISVTLAVLDKLAASYRINELSQLANSVAALPNLIRGGDGTTSTTYGYGSDVPILTLLPAAEALIAASSPNVVLQSIYKGIMQAFATFSAKQGFSSLDAYLASFNAATFGSALIHPNAALINFLYNNGTGGLLMQPKNVFAPITLFGTAAYTGSAFAFTHTSFIPTVNSISVTPYASQQGYTSAPGVSAQVSTAISGTLTATITASGQNAAGAVVTGRTWTAVLDNKAVGQVVAFTPSVAGDRISDATAMTFTGAAAAGAFSLSSTPERTVS
jgi:hypothetical protein